MAGFSTRANSGRPGTCRPWTSKWGCPGHGTGTPARIVPLCLPRRLLRQQPSGLVNALMALAASWREEAATLERRYHDERAARIFRLLATELEHVVDQLDGELLRLSDAAAESGYSADHLRHLVADGTIPNAGRKGAPRIRRKDLPAKPQAAHQTDPADHVARDILETFGRRRGGTEA